MSLEERIVEKLERRGLYLTTAESCTAGLLAGRIMNVSGASSVYKEGYITYANESKEKLLHVQHETLERYGAVSTQTAEEMAEGAAAGGTCLYWLLFMRKNRHKRVQISWDKAGKQKCIGGGGAEASGKTVGKGTFDKIVEKLL